MEKVKAKGAEYYDRVYKKVTTDTDIKSQTWIEERDIAVLPYLKGNVLDLGCGLGTIANGLENRPKNNYLGVDFCQTAIDYAKANCKNSMAAFLQRDILSWNPSFDTWDIVLLLEVLEHIENPSLMCKRAIVMAKKRLIVTVPRDMPGRAHIKATWTRLDLERMLGNLSVCELFGGPEDDRWWLAVKEKRVVRPGRQSPRIPLETFGIQPSIRKTKPK